MRRSGTSRQLGHCDERGQYRGDREAEDLATRSVGGEELAVGVHPTGADDACRTHSDQREWPYTLSQCRHGPPSQTPLDMRMPSSRKPPTSPQAPDRLPERLTPCSRTHNLKK